MTNLGCTGEAAAQEFLRKKGYQIITCNYRSRYGEIDIIAQLGQYIVFVEVKARSTGAYTRPGGFVTVSKQKKLIRTAAIYLAEKQSSLASRFDVVEVEETAGRLFCNHIENAFEMSDGYAFF